MDTPPNSETKQFWLAAIFVAISLLVYRFAGRDRRIKKYVDSLPGPFSLPVLGSGLWMLRPNYEIPDLFLKWYKEYGTVFRFWLGTQANVVLGGTPEIEKILTSNIHINKSTDYSWLHKWLGLGLLTASREKWHPRRKQLTPAFHFKILEEFVPIFNEQANVMVEMLQTEDTGNYFDIFPYVTKCALDIICETAMGIQLNAQKSKEQLEYVKIIYGYGEILLRRFLRPWLQIEWVWRFLGYGRLEDQYLKSLHDFTENVIKARKAERQEFKDLFQNNKNTEQSKQNVQFVVKKRKAFLDLLLDLSEGENPLTDVEIREETDTFMFEGHDTTAASMVWTIFLLSLHQDHQKKVQKELDEIFENNPNRDITAADVSKMKYLECCIKEALRLYPSVAFFIRHLEEDFDIGKGRLIPKGTNVYIGPLLVHRNPIIYSEPEEYNPERFLPSENRSPFAFIPFSAGPRNCIGQKFAFLEEKIVLAKLLLHYNFKSKAKCCREVKMVPDMILRPYKGIHVKISTRL